jgi:hypothetical protein
MIDVKTINRILLARRLYELACEHLKSEIDLSLSIGVNLLQDAVETFLVAIAAHVQADVGDRTHFDQYFDAINKKTGNTLPLRARLNDLNKLRVNSKHRGLAPAKSEVSDLPIIVKAFFEEVSSSILGCHFASISLIDLMKDGEAKDLLIQASASFENGAYEECLVACRKAIYVKIESSYDILPFADGNPRGLLGIYPNNAPYYARGPEYIEKYVREPTDYIVFDHDKIEIEFIKLGIDSQSFWNIWRLTPEVYRYGRDGAWVVKRELKKVDNDGIQERAEYVLDTVINLFVSSDQKQSFSKSPKYINYFVRLRQANVPVYEKADKTSKVVGTTPEGLAKLNVTCTVPGLKKDGLYWEVNHFKDDLYLMGYISDEFVDQ